MGKEQHSTDEIFRSVLREQETPPPADAWFNIQKALDSKKRVRFIWTLRALAATVALLVTFASGYYIANHKNNLTRLTENPINQLISKKFIAQPGNSSPNEKKALPISPGSNKNTQPSVANNSLNVSNNKNIDNQDVNPIVSTIQISQTTSTGLLENESVSAENSQLNFLLPLQARVNAKQIGSPGISRIIVQPLMENHLSGEEIVMEDKPIGNPSKGSRWSMGGQVSPLYAFRQTSESGGKAAAAFNPNAVASGSRESGIFSYSGGLNVEFKAGKRLSISSGLYYSRLGQNINGNQTIPSYTNVSSTQTSELFNYAFQNSTGTLKPGGGSNPIVTGNIGEKYNADISMNLLAKGSGAPGNIAAIGESATLLQSMDFLEIPFLLRYKLIDRKLGLHLLGGLSTQVLTGSKLFLETPSGQQSYGTTGGLSTFNYSGTFGFGLEYSISSNIHLNLEPAFKYYINSINSSGNIESHPYSLGIYTGMRYTF